MALYDPSSGRERDQPSPGPYQSQSATSDPNPSPFEPTGASNQPLPLSPSPYRPAPLPKLAAPTPSNAAPSTYQTTAAGSSFGSGPGGAATLGDLQGWNQSLFGGTLTDLSPWVGQKDAYTNLANSAQARAYAASQQAPAATAPTAATGDPLTRFRTALKAGDPAAQQQAFNDYFASRGATPEDWAYWGPKLTGPDSEYYLTQKLPYADALGGGGPVGAAAGSTFSDPATQQWEQLLRSMVDKLNQPVNNPDFGPLTDYLRQYATKLQGPAYTPAQMDLQQTQALDPLERQRQATHQQIIQRFAARGMSPDSGIVQKAISDADNQFNQMRTQTQAGFANNAIGLDRQNAQQAGSVLSFLSQLQNSQAGLNENRGMQGVDLFSQIPAMADNRLRLALATMQPNTVNPASLLSSLPQFMSIGAGQQQQNQNMWAQIFSAIPGLASLFA